MALDTRTPRQYEAPPATAQAPRLATRAAYSPPAYRHSNWGLRIALVALEAFVAITAIYGAIYVIPTIPMEWLRAGVLTPFADTTIPALALGVICGGGSIIALISVLAWPRIGALVSILAGAAMVTFEVVEILVVGFTPVLYPTNPVGWLQVVYILIGAAIMALGTRLWKAETGTYRLLWPPL